MATVAELEQALINADKAGNTEDARILARELQRAMQGSAPTAPEETIFRRPPPETSFLGEAARSAESLASSVRTGFGSLLGKEEAATAAEAGLERQQAIAERYGAAPSFQDYVQTYREEGLLPAIGEAISDVPEFIGSQAPVITSLVAGSRLGAMAGAPLGPYGGAIGGIGGGLLALFPQFYGANIERQAQVQIERGEEVDIDRARAAAGAAAQSAFESVGTGVILGKKLVKKVLGLADEAGDVAIQTNRARQQLLERSQRSLAGGARRAALGGAAAEVPVEIAQQVVERYQAGLDVLSDDALQEYGDAAYAALVVGGGLAGPRGAVETLGARREFRMGEEAAQAEQRAEQEAVTGAVVEARTAEQEAQAMVAPLLAVDERRRAEARAAEQADTLRSTTVIPNTVADLKAWGRTVLGIGPSADIIKADGALAGKDISDPAQAAEVRSILEAYASAPKRSSSIIAKIEEYLQRPEFAPAAAPEEVIAPEVVTEEVIEEVAAPPTEPTTQFVALENEPQVDRRTTAYLESLRDVDTTVAKGKSATAEQTVAKYMKRFTPGSALQVLVAEAAPKFTEREVAGTQEEAQEALFWLMPKLSKRGQAVVARTERNVETIKNNIERYKERAKRYAEQQEQLKEERILTKKEAEKASKTLSEAAQELRVAQIMEQNPDISKEDAIKLYRVEQKEYRILAGTKDTDVDENDKLARLLEAKINMNNPEIGGQIPMGKERERNDLAKEVAEFISNGGKVKELPSVRDPDWKKQTIGAPIYKGKSFNQETADLIRKGNVNEIITALLYKQAAGPAKLLRKIRNLGINPTIIVAELPEGRSGQYDAGTDTITISPQFGMNEQTILHELGHAALARGIANPNLKISKDFVRFFEQLKGQLGDAYGGQNLQEFAAEYIGNPEFQALLKTIKAPRSDNYFVNIMQAIAEFFGFRTADKAAYKFISDLLDVSQDISPRIGDVLAMATPAAQVDAMSKIEQFGREATKSSLRKTNNVLDGIADFGYKKKAYGLLRYDNVKDLWGQRLAAAKARGEPNPTLQTAYDTLSDLIAQLELRLGAEEKMRKALNKKYEKFEAIQKKHPDATERLGKLAQDIRRARISFNKADQTPFTKNPEYAKLKARLDALPKPVRDMYIEMRNDFDSMYEQFKAFVAKVDKDNNQNGKLLEEFLNDVPVEGYVPFTRFGDFIVDTKRNGIREVHPFESSRARDEFIKAEGLKAAEEGAGIADIANGQYIAYERGRQPRYDVTVPSSVFLTRLMDSLPADADPEAQQAYRDAIFQTYLSVYPAGSLNKNFMKAAELEGASTDLVRTYADTMIKWSRKMPQTEYMQPIDNAIKYFRPEELGKKGVTDPDILAFAANIQDRQNFIRNPSYNPITTRLTTASFGMFILGSVASAVVNLSVLPMLVFPTLAARFGYTNATAAMNQARKVVGKSISDANWGMTGGDWGTGTKYKNLFNTLQDHGQLEHTLAREVMEGSRMRTEDYSSMSAKIMNLLAVPFSATERYNRAFTAVSAYELAKRDGMSEANAVQFALKTVKDMNTSGTHTTAAPLMQTDLGRVFFTFKSFNINSAYVIGRAWKNAVAGEDPQLVAMARRQLLGIYAMSGAIAGMAGLPFMGSVAFLANLLVPDDEDEPFDLKEEMRLAAGELAYRGPLSYLTNLDIGSRVALANDLVFRDDPRGVAEAGYMRTALMTAFGPMGSAAINFERGMNEIADGNTYRGVEYMMPTFVRNFMRGGRYMVDGGVMTLNGDVITTDISAYSKVMQMAGFAPTNLSDLYERRAFASRREEFLNAKKTQYLTEIFAARQANDLQGEIEARRRLQELGRRNPGLIDENTISRSINAREARLREDLNGLRLSRVGERIARERYGLGED